MTDPTPPSPGSKHDRDRDTVRGLLTAESLPALLSVDGSAVDHHTLTETVDRLAAQLRSFGLGPNDRIAVVLGNGPEMALVMLAVMATGCAAPMNPNYRADEFAAYLEDLCVAAIITGEGQSPAARSATPVGAFAVEMRGSQFAVELIASRTVVPQGTPSTRPNPTDEALVLHTSGTTSRPKIVPLTQRNLARSARNIAATLELVPADRSLNVMPLFHIHGLMAGLLAPLSVGGSVACTPGFDAFQFHRWVDALRPTYYSAVPTIHQMVLARAPRPCHTSLRLIRSSSAALPGSVHDALVDLFAVPVIEAYGMTEASHQMTSNPLPPRLVKRGSVGVATHLQVAVIDPSNAELPTGVRGEVAIRGDTVMGAYENNPDANCAAFTDRWFRTGDEGMFDADGYLYLTGRLKEQINRGGEKISPVEIDDVLLRHPAVGEAVTFAVVHEMLGDDVAAAVVLNVGSLATEIELRAHVRQHLAAFKVPRRILIVAEIPKGPTGKLQRIGLAEQLGLQPAAWQI